MTAVVKNILKYTILAILALIAFFVGCALFLLRYIPLDSRSYEAIIIENVTVVDLVNDTLLLGRNILIKDKHIQKITAEPLRGITGKNLNIKVIEGSGKYVIPALWDMHVHLMHLSPYLTYPSFLRHGVTNVRDMRGAYNKLDPFAAVQSRLEQSNKAVTAYALAGPRIHGYSSFAIDGPNPMFNNSPDFFNCATPEDAKKLITYFVENDITLIKIYNKIPREAFFTLMHEANAVGITVAGHKPVRVSTIEASNAGMKSLAHAKFFI